MIFVGWLIYFSLGFYIGNYYEAFISNIKKFTIPIILLFTFATIFMIYNYYSGAISIVESKRADIPFYCTSIILLFFLVSSYINYLPKFILFISNYSFSIYLTHYFFVHRLGQLSDSPETNIIFTFILTVTLSLLTAQIFNAFRWGKFIVGGVGKLKYEEVVGRNY
ncbi:hypothetical protein GCM10022378_17360 [Salinicoccus jeotgali]|uniref:Acyltransferase 3 domain-containing protein n=2 Tax=Salinicoccus jeotgali TaxID=381634 RepID=A0ABP7F489_9STAP